MDTNAYKGNPQVLDKINPELGGKLVKAVADDMQRAKKEAEEEKQNKQKPKRGKDKSDE